MVLFICIIPNRGARIGHQTYDHFTLVTYCKKYGFNFVYHPFIGKAQHMGNSLHFDKKHTYHYDTLKQMRRVNIANFNNTNIHLDLLALHKKNENILLFDEICGNESFFSRLPYRQLATDMIAIKKEYRIFYKDFYPKPVTTDYVCIHIRRGDIVNISSRVLDIDYFIEKYRYLIAKENIELPVYILTEANFNEHQKLYDAIPLCKIVQCGEIDAFYYLVNCTYLIASRSGYSNLAYILGGMKVIKPPLDWNIYWDNVIE